MIHDEVNGITLTAQIWILETDWNCSTYVRKKNSLTLLMCVFQVQSSVSRHYIMAVKLSLSSASDELEIHLSLARLSGLHV